MSGPVIDNKAKSRFEIHIDGAVAFADYRIDGDKILFVHTQTPADLRGRGIGAKLAHGALTLARQAQLKIVPMCSFIEDFVAAHPEFRD